MGKSLRELNIRDMDMDYHHYFYRPCHLLVIFMIIIGLIIKKIMNYKPCLRKKKRALFPAKMVDNAKYMTCYRLSPARENKNFYSLINRYFYNLNCNKIASKFLRPFSLLFLAHCRFLKTARRIRTTKMFCTFNVIRIIVSVNSVFQNFILGQFKMYLVFSKAKFR